MNSQNLSICDKYTIAIFGGSANNTVNNTAANQLKVLTLVVNTALIGNYYKPSNVNVTGILNKGEYGNESINLLPYFTGQTMTDNPQLVGGSGINWIDGGGVAALNQSLPAFNTSSKQYLLVTHLYSYCGALLGCSQISNATNATFPAYTGISRMYELHKFMNLTSSQINYFIQQIGLSASSFGVNDDDITTVANLLNSTFNVRCAKAQPVVTSDPELQSICSIPSCPLAANNDCTLYGGTSGGTATTAPSTSAPTAPSTPVITAAPTSAAGGGQPLQPMRVSIVVGAASKGDQAFSPNPVNAKVNQEVIWTNDDDAVHTVTSQSGNELLQLSALVKGATYSHTFTAPGTYNYVCSIHPTMHGQVIVT